MYLRRYTGGIFDIVGYPNGLLELASMMLNTGVNPLMGLKFNKVNSDLIFVSMVTSSVLAVGFQIIPMALDIIQMVNVTVRFCICLGIP